MSRGSLDSGPWEQGSDGKFDGNLSMRPLVNKMGEWLVAGVSSSPVWWLLPGKLGGMPMPFFDPRRQHLRGNALAGIKDELTQLSGMAVRALVCLVDAPIEASIYQEAGFELLCLPMANGSPPTREQWLKFCRFVDQQLAGGQAVVVFCQAGLGRTGTMLAAYLVHGGQSADTAIARVRGIEPAAIDTPRQMAFLHEIEGLSLGGATTQDSLAHVSPPLPRDGAA